MFHAAIPWISTDKEQYPQMLFRASVPRTSDKYARYCLVGNLIFLQLIRPGPLEVCHLLQIGFTMLLRQRTHFSYGVKLFGSDKLIKLLQ